MLAREVRALKANYLWHLKCLRLRTWLKHARISRMQCAKLILSRIYRSAACTLISRIVATPRSGHGQSAGASSIVIYCYMRTGRARAVCPEASVPNFACIYSCMVPTSLFGVRSSDSISGNSFTSGCWEQTLVSQRKTSVSLKTTVL